MTFYEIVKKLCERDKISIHQLELNLGLGNGSIGKLAKTGGIPRADRIKQIAGYFGVPVNALLTGNLPEGTEEYYVDDQTKEIAQFLFDNPEYGVLFDAAKDVRPEDIQLVIRMIKGVNSTNDSSNTGC